MGEVCFMIVGFDYELICQVSCFLVVVCEFVKLHLLVEFASN